MIFYKMLSLKNDYLVTDYLKNIDYKEVSKKICNRITGVGASALIVCKKEPFEILVYNNLGEEVDANLEMLAIFTRYVYELKYVTKRGFEIFNHTHKENVTIDNLSPFVVSITPHSKASYEKAMMSMHTHLEVFGRVVGINDIKITTYPLYFYGIHTIVFVDDFNSKSVEYKKVIAKDPIYTKPSLIDFVKIIDKKTIEVKAYNIIDDSLKDNLTSAMSSLYVMNKLGMVKNKINVKFEYGITALELDKSGFCKTSIEVNRLFKIDIDDILLN